MRIAKVFFLILLVGRGSSRAQTPLPGKAAVAKIIDSLARDFVDSRGSPSVAIGVVRGTDTITMQAWGIAYVQESVPATAATIYKIGSVTKQFTSSAVMLLVEKKKIRLDDSIAAYLPELPPAWRPVTIRQLLNHTSGIPSYTDLGPTWQARWTESMAPATIVGLTANVPMNFAPGSSWRYNNTGYVILGMLIEKMTGHSWEGELADRFFKPLKLADTRVCPDTALGRDAHGYTPAGPIWWPAPALSMSQPYAAGALCSTVGDMIAWNRALHTGKVVSAASYALMTTPVGSAAPAKYGFGLMSDSAFGYALLTHGGGIHGFVTSNVWFPGPQLSITVLTNSGGAHAQELLGKLERASLGKALEIPPRARPITAAERAQFIGVYSVILPTGSRDFTVAEAGEGLTGQLAGQGANPLLYYGDNTFGMAFDPSLRLIFTIENGLATKMVLVQGGVRVDALRK